MVGKNSTRSSRNKQRTAPSEIGGEQTCDANMNPSDRNAEADDTEGTATVTESPTQTNSTTKVKLPKKKTSAVWKHYDEIFVEEMVDDMIITKPMASCKYCDDVLNAPSNQGTTRLWNHYSRYHDEKKAKPGVKKVSLDLGKYDEETSLRKYYLSIIMHEYPFNYCEHEYTNDFIRSLRPYFPIMGRKTARTRIMEIFHDEKKKLFDYFSSFDCRFSCTMDEWTSNQNKSYLCVTCHFIDDEWKIQKRIINFMHLKGGHSGKNLSVAFVQNMASWNLDDKLFALTLDNASSNKTCVDTIISILQNLGSVHCSGKFFHVRCAAHTMNLIARDGLSKISSVIDNICAIVLIIKSSPLQEEDFQKEANRLGLTERGLSLDVATRWNSTYLMLADALHFRYAIQKLILLNSAKYGKYAPSRDDWENAATLCNCLEIFYEATKLLSGSHYPTANLFFSEFSEINLKIMEWNKSKNNFIVSMEKAMKEKFDKYWEKSNVALAVACFLDPRYKMKVVEFYYSEMSDDYGFDDMYEFKKFLHKLYDSYASIYTPDASSPMQESTDRNRRNVRTSLCYADLNEEPRRKRLNSFLRENTESDQHQSDIDTYCNEPLLSWKEGDYFDILSWWKAHGARYPILARVARDVLAIPATTVASESAFSSGGRIVHKYRTRLDPQTVEALICTKDWVRASKKDTSGVSSIDDDLTDLGLDIELQQDEGDPADAVEDITELDVTDN